jgi:hypothetical protein
MYMVWQTWSYAGTLYFFFLWLFGERFIINLVLAIVTFNFSKARDTVDSEKNLKELEFETFNISLFKRLNYYKSNI